MIIGPLSITLTNAMPGEVTAKMAAAIVSSPAKNPAAFNIGRDRHSRSEQGTPAPFNRTADNKDKGDRKCVRQTRIF